MRALVGSALALAAAMLFGAPATALAGTPAGPDPLTCEGYPEQRVFLESQSWWSDERQPFPGAHIHLGTCFPLLQEISGVVHFDVRVILHHDPGEVNLLRVQIFDNGENPVYAEPLSWRCPEGTCEQWFPIDIDTSTRPYDGRWEFRFTANVPVTPEGPNSGNRQYQTTRWAAILRNGKPVRDGQGIDRVGAAGWYTNSGYANVFIRHDDALEAAFGTVCGVWVPEIRAEMSRLVVAVDAANHGHDPGVVFYDGPGNDVWRAVELDTTTLADGPHKLFLRTDDPGSNGTSSGIFVLPFVVSNSGGAGLPSVALLSPADGSTVSGTIAVEASASNDGCLRQVEFSVDGAVAFTDASPPYSFAWDTSGLPDGSQHILTATAYDVAGNVTVSAPITVTVSNRPPTASFTHSCSALTCTFDASTSSDEGPLQSVDWDFGDGSTGSGMIASHTYAAGGTYLVGLTVTDGVGAIDMEQASVTVTSTSIVLTAEGYKVSGLQKVRLTWSGVTTSRVRIYRDGVKITTTANDGVHVDPVNRTGSGAYVYRVCDTRSVPACSADVTVTF